MNSVSNKTLVYLLMIAIVVSLIGTFVSLSKLGALSATGFVSYDNDTGDVNLTVTTSCTITMSGSNINFGSGTVSGDKCELNTSAGTVGGGCSGFTAVSHGLNFTNDGNENITLNITSNVTAETFLKGTNPLFKINANNIESGACNNGNFSLGSWVDVVTTQLSLCNSTNPLEPTDDKDTLEIDVYLSIPDNTGGAGGFAELKLIGIC
jgi:hypothetical protein